MRRTAGILSYSVGTRERLPVGRSHVHVRGKGRAPRSAAVGEREQVHMGRKHVRVRGERAISS